MPTVTAFSRPTDWLSRERLIAYARVLLVVELAVFAVCVAGTHGMIVPLKHPTSSDFVSFYAAGHLANSPEPWLAYHRAAHYAAEQAATAPGIVYNYFYYPPVFLLVCGLLARLPYLAAFIAFQAMTVALCVAAVRSILPRVPISALLAFPAVFWTFGTGQNAFLSAALFAAATVQLERRPVLAGVLFGAICYKPDLGLLIPVALIAGRHWRTFVAAAATVVVLVLVSLAVYGLETWQAFWTAAIGASSVYTTHSVDVAGYTSPFGLLLTLGGGRHAAGLVQLLVMAGTGLLVWVVWRHSRNTAVRAAVLLAATPVAVPMIMFYDLMLTGIAMGWLVRNGLQRGFAPWDKPALILLFCLSLFSGNVQIAAPLSRAALAAMLGLLLAGAAAWRDWRHRSVIVASGRPSAGNDLIHAVGCPCHGEGGSQHACEDDGRAGTETGAGAAFPGGRGDWPYHPWNGQHRGGDGGRVGAGPGYLPG